MKLVEEVVGVGNQEAIDVGEESEVEITGEALVTEGSEKTEGKNDVKNDVNSVEQDGGAGQGSDEIEERIQEQLDSGVPEENCGREEEKHTPMKGGCASCKGVEDEVE